MARASHTIQELSYGFQSLLSWISRFGIEKRRREAELMGFQSLLSWISRFGPYNRVSVVAEVPSFNPCCLGLAVLASGATAVATLDYTFQSLLSWISRFGSIPVPQFSGGTLVSILVVLD